MSAPSLSAQRKISPPNCSKDGRIDVVIVPFRASPDVVCVLRDDIQRLSISMPRSSQRSTAARRGSSPPARRSARRNCRTFRRCRKAASPISTSRMERVYRRRAPTPSSNLEKALREVLADPILRNARSSRHRAKAQRRQSSTRAARRIEKWTGDRAGRNCQAVTCIGSL